MSADHRYSRSLVLGFHGCDESIGRQLIAGEVTHLKPSKNPYDWLGDGIYFFENDPERALHFAVTAAEHPERQLTKGRIEAPFVIGAVIDLRNCLDLSHQQGIREAADALEALKISRGDKPLPVNKRANDEDDDIIVRNLDRAIVNYLHVLRKGAALSPYDSVRCPFSQGKPLADTSFFHEYSHVQIAVRNTNCILGYFLPQNPLSSPFQGLVN
ncbi:hypothetical protein [Candidimonas nitroreducens]|uniref:DUF3990 domain-containing protein n=1 Tax=Candidimonas nitroreducens TaxID=683354 RepID=A0A225M9Z4_9BURK|nr:hypothetical protein [Candidimonas nitroreducens]OWT57552.1 hypothetical protein CEY11_16770 [Candidimonas nitroreducens]